jgi:hypothetical protein
MIILPVVPAVIENGLRLAGPIFFMGLQASR